MRLEDFNRGGIQSFLREALEERIHTGQHDREWRKAQQSEEPVLERLLERVGRHPIAEAEKRLREAPGTAYGEEESGA